MAPHFPRTSRETQELRRVLLIALRDSRRRIRYITHGLLTLTRQREALERVLLPMRTEPCVLPLHPCPPSIHDCVSRFLLEDDDEALLDAMNAGVLWDHLHTVERKVWAHPSSTDWWERVVLGTWDDELWLQTFRMRRDTFMDIAAQVAPHIARQDIVMRPTLSPEKRVAIAVLKLATPGSLRYIANQFGVGRSTAGEAVREVCLVIQDVLANRFIRLINPQEVVAGFRCIGFPNCVGAMDSTHIPIVCPPQGGQAFINRKGYYSVILQGVVDHRGRFTHIYAGWAGSAHDARVFRNSPLPNLMESGRYASGLPDCVIGDVVIPPLIIGNPAYPFLPWLMKPYEGQLDRRKEHFNQCLSRCRMAVESAFCRLKARWRALSARLEVDKENLPRLISAACVLHNICETRGEVFLESWAEEAQRADRACQRERTRRRDTDEGEPSATVGGSGTAQQQAGPIREALADYLVTLADRGAEE
ncbi:PREDICTED: uncharacterized protein LOC109296671 [Gavialis gangeticus]|uniref:uncharacterized protein LOC109296671 n=1 Tax=Gavialis gangeticus TaxID=94835 RepID=UPI00092EA313|nr:PREDICTED: uncharacterized protein LOC109296671 [Gavialis gangeticus]